MKHGPLMLLLCLLAGFPAQLTADEPKGKEDPAATRLLADARAARANWKHFPGFTADLEINVDGQVTRATVSVSSQGKVEIDALKQGNDDAVQWARRLLSSTIGHRLDDGTDLQTPCAFSDENVHHPLGRAIRVLNDEYHSSYRIRERQVIEVNRQMKDTRFTISVLENRLNEDKQFLPACYVVNYWDVKTEALKSSETHHDTWHRVGAFDLPATHLVVTATAGKQEARSVKLSNWKLSGQ